LRYGAVDGVVAVVRYGVDVGKIWMGPGGGG